MFSSGSYIQRDAEGKPRRMIGLATDISSRKLMEEKLRQSEAELRKYAEEISDLYHNAPCGYHSLGPDGTFLKMNQTELNWLGYTSDEMVLKKKWTDVLTPAGVKTYEATFPVFKKRGWINNVELDLVRKDGSLLTVNVNATAIRDTDGNFVMSRSTLFDMAERKKAEEELRESEQLYRTALESSNDGVTIHRDGIYVYVNQNFLNTFGAEFRRCHRQTGGVFHPSGGPGNGAGNHPAKAGWRTHAHPLRGSRDPEGRFSHLPGSLNDPDLLQGSAGPAQFPEGHHQA